MRVKFRNIAARALLLAALIFPAAAAAQEAPPKPDAQIVVIGTRTTDDEIADFVDAFTVAPQRGQLARFEFAVCPFASGLAPQQKQAVADRLRAVAKAAGVAVGGPGCAPNVLVIVTSAKKALIELLQRRRPEYFGDLRGPEIRVLAESAEPAVAWHIKGPPVDADGRELSEEAGADYYVNRTIRPAGRITFAARPQFSAAIVVVERGALEGLTATQLADYAAMRTLIRTDPSRLGKSAAPTILKVLGAPMGTPVPVTLTQWDLGVLRGFYAADPNLTTAAQRSAVRKGVKKAVGGGD